MKFTTTLGSATRTVGKVLFALILLLVAVAAGFGGTALIVYHGLGGGRTPVARQRVERKAAGVSQDRASVVKKENDGPRQVAALPSDQPLYTYADNRGGQPSTLVRRVRPASTVPAALETPAATANGSANAVGNLNDPESRYIVDAHTGRVVGIDGSAGARREEEEERQRLESLPRAVAVQTPAPEVRVASAVMEDGQPVYRDGQKIAAAGSGAQYVPVRRALPVDGEDASAETRNFSVAEYLAGGEVRPVLRAQSVNTDRTAGGRTTRVYRLSNGSPAVSVD